MSDYNYEFRILIDTEEGYKYSYGTSSLVSLDANTSKVVTTEDALSRINSMHSMSYYNAPAFTTGSALYTEAPEQSIGSGKVAVPTFEETIIGGHAVDYQYVSCSIKDNNLSGSIIFHSNTTPYTTPMGDTRILKRYKFWGNKVCQVLGLPENYWIYSDKFRLSNTGSEANYISGDVLATSLNLKTNFAINNAGSITSDLPFRHYQEADRFVRWTDVSSSIPNNKMLIGYNQHRDEYGIEMPSQDHLMISASAVTMSGDLIIQGRGYNQDGNTIDPLIGSEQTGSFLREVVAGSSQGSLTSTSAVAVGAVISIPDLTTSGKPTFAQITSSGQIEARDDIILRDGSGTGDTLVRIYDSNDDGVIDVYQNNAVKIHLDGNGDSYFMNQLCIGHTSTTYNLGVHQGSSAANYIHITNTTTGNASNSGFLVGIDSFEQAKLWQSENDNMIFGTNNTERMRLTAGGLLNIGEGMLSTSPQFGDGRVNISASSNVGLVVEADDNATIGNPTMILCGNNRKDATHSSTLLRLHAPQHNATERGNGIVFTNSRNDHQWFIGRPYDYEYFVLSHDDTNSGAIPYIASASIIHKPSGATGFGMIPTYHMDITDSPGPGSCIMRIKHENTLSNQNNHILSLQMGVSEPDTDGGEWFVSFLDGNGTHLGRIEADGSGGVTDPSAFTGKHPSVIASGSYEIGMIVESTGEIWARHTASLHTGIPKVSLSTTDSSKKVYGVMSKLSGSYEGYVSKWGVESDEMHININSLGEGLVWVTNKNGNIDNGDYIVSSVIPGYGQKQNDDLLRNSTVAKSVETIDWNSVTDTITYNGTEYKKYLIACTYHCG